VAGRGDKTGGWEASKSSACRGRCGAERCWGRSGGAQRSKGLLRASGGHPAQEEATPGGCPAQRGVAARTWRASSTAGWEDAKETASEQSGKARSQGTRMTHAQEGTRGATPSGEEQLRGAEENCAQNGVP
jgi:hypothetical protein